VTAASIEVIKWTYPHQIGTHNALTMAAGIAIGRGKPTDPSLAMTTDATGFNLMLVWDDDAEICLRVDTSTWQGALRLLLAS
jgi:hypothetical protein